MAGNTKPARAMLGGAEGRKLSLTDRVLDGIILNGQRGPDRINKSPADIKVVMEPDLW